MTSSRAGIIIAAGDGHHECVEVLIEAGADLDATDDQGRCAVEHARSQGHEEIAVLLVNAGASAAAVHSVERRLLVAAESGDVEGVRAALAQGAPVDTRDQRVEQEGRTPLMLAARGGHVDCLDVLLDNEADVNASDDPGAELNRYSVIWEGRRNQTALMMAAEEGHASAVRRLIEAGAEVSPQDVNRDTALTRAAYGCHVDCVRALLGRRRRRQPARLWALDAGACRSPRLS